MVMNNGCMHVCSYKGERSGIEPFLGVCMYGCVAVCIET